MYGWSVSTRNLPKEVISRRVIRELSRRTREQGKLPSHAIRNARMLRRHEKRKMMSLVNNSDCMRSTAGSLHLKLQIVYSIFSKSSRSKSSFKHVLHRAVFPKFLGVTTRITRVQCEEAAVGLKPGKLQTKQTNKMAKVKLKRNPLDGWLDVYRLYL